MIYSVINYDVNLISCQKERQRQVLYTILVLASGSGSRKKSSVWKRDTVFRFLGNLRNHTCVLSAVNDIKTVDVQFC